MKNKFLLIVLVVLLMPMYAFADVKEIKKEDYKSMNLVETLAEEEIEPEFSNYEENDKQITIYLFRGKGCAYCKKFLTFLNSITEEYGKYFKLESYEVWYDSKNSKLFDEVSEFLDEPAGGVPYIIIGDNVFTGYNEQYDESIKAAIKELYESEEKYDVFEAMAKAFKEQNKVDYRPIIITVACNFILVAIASGLILGYISNKNKELNKRLDELQMSLKDFEKENKKSTKKEEIIEKKAEIKTTKNKPNTKSKAKKSE